MICPYNLMALRKILLTLRFETKIEVAVTRTVKSGMYTKENIKNAG